MLRTELYPPIEPFHHDFLSVSSLHTIYFEECGNPKGVPVIFLHGGPGGGLQDWYRQFFDPQFYRVILFDQRGCGKSKPFACLKENTTWDLVEDIEKLRKHLHVEKFILFGGSWGSTLSLAYATKHPEQLLGMILRGIFLCRPLELNWFYEEGCSYIFPDFWENYLSVLKPEEYNHKIKAYYQKLTSDNPELQAKAAKSWSVWEGSTVKLVPEKATVDNFGEEQFALSLARIECHYFLNKAFFPTDNYLLEQAPRYSHIPGVIVHGRYDVVCPMTNAWELHKVWSKSDLRIMEVSGHSCSEADIKNELVKACEEFKEKVTRN